MHHVSNSGPVCRWVAFPHITCELAGARRHQYSRFHPENYLSHHLAGIVTAAVFADAKHIVEEVTLLKTRVNGATPAAAAAGPT